MNPGEGNSLPSGPDATQRKVCYFYDAQIGNYSYGTHHSMKPHRIRVTHSLLSDYGLLHRMDVVAPTPAIASDLTQYHTDDYIGFLESVIPENVMMPDYADRLKQFNLGVCDSDGEHDCPVIEGLYSFCTSYAGGSISAAARLNHGSHDVAINWSGGLHHAKRCSAGGFCYVNDIVLAILELLKNHQRVLYVDIDVHHGDGVEEAFYHTDRVMTVSFHQQRIFPYTGHIDDNGYEQGKHYSVNVPLNRGINDDSYLSLFKPIIAKVMEVYQPEAVVLQCGADSLAGDRLGDFNLSVRGHAECVRFLRSFNVPLLLLGGGGYTIGNVARCWCYETGVAVGVELDDRLPQNNRYLYYFSQCSSLRGCPRNTKNENSGAYLQKVKSRVLENLSKLQHVPSVQFQERPPDAMFED